MKKIIYIVIVLISGLAEFFSFVSAHSAIRNYSKKSLPRDLAHFSARPFIHIFGNIEDVPRGLTPLQVKKAYHLPLDGGSGIIAIIGAFDNPYIEHDLAIFSQTFHLPLCSKANGCFRKVLLSKKIKSDSMWELESALDVEWAHAIAPRAKIVLIEAEAMEGPQLLRAVDYASKLKGVVSVGMSWGGPEFMTESHYDSHFNPLSKKSKTRSRKMPVFFAASGDSGAGVSWPAASASVVSVGGTSLHLLGSKKVSENAWSGSGGGVSQFEPEPDYQVKYGVPKAGGGRAVPDVAYNADPMVGFSVYHAAMRNGEKGPGWYVLGGTSAGAPQWAAINALGASVTLEILYDVASSHPSPLRDITKGKNGTCKYFCHARKAYDYVTGLGTPLTAVF